MITKFALTPLSLAFALSLLPAQANEAAPSSAALELGLTLDGGFSSRDLALGSRERGFSVGHTELSLGGAIDPAFSGRATAVLHQHEGATELELEEAYVETQTLPAGLQVRAGRFLSQIGYLNPQHVHTDDFSERPLLYRAFLGSHYFDDGLRVNWLLPTPFYWQLGAEALSGKTLTGVSETRQRVGAYTVSSKLGGDIGTTHSWQFGLSYLRNQLLGEAPVEEEEEDAHSHEDEHGHSHAGNYQGRHLYLADAVWKWAPGGNNRERQLRLSAEYARLAQPSLAASKDDAHQAWYLAAALRLNPQWEVAARLDELKVLEAHDDHFHKGRVQERSLALAYKPSHFSTVRLQFSQQRDRGGFAAASNAVSLNYTMSLGAHGAHAF